MACQGDGEVEIFLGGGGDIFGGGGENGSVWKLVENWRKLWLVEEGRD